MKNSKRVKNQECEQEEGTSQTKSEDSIEMNERPRNSDVSLSLDISKQEQKSKANPQPPKRGGNFVVNWNLEIRALLRNFLLGKSRTTKIFWLLLANGVALGVLVASIIQKSKNDSSEIEWCNGVGFLWILYGLVYIVLFYNLFSKYVGPSVHRCLKPVFSCFSHLRNIKTLEPCGSNIATFLVFLYLGNYWRVYYVHRLLRWILYCIPVVAITVYVILSPGKSGRRIFSFTGLVVFVIFGYLFSKHPAQVNWRPVICGMLLQFIFGLLTIQLEAGRDTLDCLGKKVTNFLRYTEEGTVFVFGFLAKPENNSAPIFAFSVLPVIYFLGFFINILSYYGALQWFIMNVSKVVRLGMGTTVCESVHATASIFLGMTEAPLLIQKYLKDLTKSEICSILCAGWSTVAGSVMAAYIQNGVKASHLIAASVMSAPASLGYSKLMYPETQKSKTTVDNIVLHKEEASNFLDAASKGALNGILVIGSIIANIIAFLGFIAFVDGLLLWIGAIIGFEQLSFQFVVTKIFYPISFLMGIDVESLEDVAYLVGLKTVVNEFEAYQKLGELIKANKISERSEIIATYALCGFSNFGSIGITVGTLSVMEPRQAGTVTEVALRAFIAANIVCFLTACVAGCLID